MKTVAVITSTTGRDSLRKTAQSVQTQTYPCQHYVIYDGVAKSYWHGLPENTKIIGKFNHVTNFIYRTRVTDCT